MGKRTPVLIHAVFILILALATMNLGAVDIVAGEGVVLDADLLRQLNEALDEHGSALVPPDVDVITISAVSEDQEAIYLTVSGWTMAFDKDRLYASIDEQVGGFFSYPVFIKEQQPPRLQYIAGSSYSTYELPEARRGEVYDLVSPVSGDVLSRFIVSDVDAGVTHLDPIFIGQAHAGLHLEAESPWKIRLNTGHTFAPYRFSGSLRLLNTSWLYPMNPSIGFETGMADDGSWYWAGLVGFEYSARLGGVIDSTFSLVQDAGLYAGIDVVLGQGLSDAGFLWGFSWRVGYEHNLTKNLSWSVGFEDSYIRSEDLDKVMTHQYRLTVGLGVGF